MCSNWEDIVSDSEKLPISVLENHRRIYGLEATRKRKYYGRCELDIFIEKNNLVVCIMEDYTPTATNFQYPDLYSRVNLPLLLEVLSRRSNLCNVEIISTWRSAQQDALMIWECILSMFKMNHLKRIKVDIHLISMKDVDWSFISQSHFTEINVQKNIELEFTLGSFVGGRNMYTEIFTFDDLKTTNTTAFINSLLGKIATKVNIHNHFRLCRKHF